MYIILAWNIAVLYVGNVSVCEISKSLQCCSDYISYTVVCALSAPLSFFSLLTGPVLPSSFFPAHPDTPFVLVGSGTRFCSMDSFSASTMPSFTALLSWGDLSLSSIWRMCFLTSCLFLRQGQIKCHCPDYSLQSQLGSVICTVCKVIWPLPQWFQ